MPTQAVCPVSEGWQQRILSKVALAGTGGFAVAATRAALTHTPVLRHGTASAASLMVIVGCFAGVTTGYFLARMQGQKFGALPAGAVLGGAAGLIHVLDDYVDINTWVKRKLVEKDMLDPAAIGRPSLDKGPPVEPWWINYLPVDKMSEEEAQAYSLWRHHRVRSTLQGQVPSGSERELVEDLTRQPVKVDRPG